MNKKLNVPSLSVNQLIDTLTLMYESYINNDEISKIPSVMLFGAPGVGKSDSVKEIAKRLEIDTKKHVNVVDIRLLLFSPVDLRGIPTFNNDKTKSIWLKPEIFDLNPSNDYINIIFLDEITAAPPSIQASAYQITLDKRIGEHKLPENTIVICAGNRLTDQSVAYKMPKALCNRLMHFEVESTFASWKKWAMDNNINAKVLSFLTAFPSKLMDFEAENDDYAYPTPRSWEKVSDVLNNVSDDIKKVYPLIEGLIGNGMAAEFRQYDKVYKNMPSVEDIFKGKSVPVPKENDIIYSLVQQMTDYAKKHKSDITGIENSIEYALNFPADFQTILFKNYMKIDKDFRNTLILIPTFNKWMIKYGKLINGTF